MCRRTFIRAKQCGHWIGELEECNRARYENRNCPSQHHELIYGRSVDDYCDRECEEKDQLWLQQQNKKTRAIDKEWRSTRELREADYRLKAAEQNLARETQIMESAQRKMNNAKTAEDRAKERLDTAQNGRDRDRARRDMQNAQDAYRGYKGDVDRASVHVVALKKTKENAERDIGAARAPAQIADGGGGGGGD